MMHPPRNCKEKIKANKNNPFLDCLRRIKAKEANVSGGSLAIYKYLTSSHLSLKNQVLRLDNPVQLSFLVLKNGEKNRSLSKIPVTFMKIHSLSNSLYPTF